MEIDDDFVTGLGSPVLPSLRFEAGERTIASRDTSKQDKEQLRLAKEQEKEHLRLAKLQEVRNRRQHCDKSVFVHPDENELC